MNDENHNDLFDIKVTEVSKKYIRKIYPLGLAAFILGITFTLINILISIYFLRTQKGLFDNSFKGIFFSVYPFYSIVYSVLSIVGNYFYFTFLRKIKRSIINADEQSYNLSFKYAYINVLFYVVVMGLSMIIIALEAVALMS